MKLTATSGSPSTVQVTLTLSPPLTDSGEASRLTNGGPLGTVNNRQQTICITKYLYETW